MEDWMNEGFVVDNDIKANWCVKKIKDAKFEADRLKAIIAAEREQLDAKEKAIDEKLKSETSYFEGQLFGYFQTVDHKSTKTQEKYELLDGTLVKKLAVKKIAKPDEEELTKYLENNNPLLVEIIKKPAWGEFKKSLIMTNDGGVVDTITGERLDFIKTEESEESFEVKV